MSINLDYFINKAMIMSILDENIPKKYEYLILKFGSFVIPRLSYIKYKVPWLN